MKAPMECRNVGKKLCTDSEMLVRQYLVVVRTVKSNMDQIASLREMAAGPRANKV